MIDGQKNRFIIIPYEVNKKDNPPAIVSNPPAKLKTDFAMKQNDQYKNQ